MRVVGYLQATRAYVLGASMTTPEDKFEYTVEAMRRFFMEERQRAADSQDAERYGWMDQNVKKLDTLTLDYWSLSGQAWKRDTNQSSPSWGMIRQTARQKRRGRSEEPLGESVAILLRSEIEEWWAPWGSNPRHPD